MREPVGRTLGGVQKLPEPGKPGQKDQDRQQDSRDRQQRRVQHAVPGKPGRRIASRIPPGQVIRYIRCISQGVEGAKLVKEFTGYYMTGEPQ